MRLGLDNLDNKLNSTQKSEQKASVKENRTDKIKKSFILKNDILKNDFDGIYKEATLSDIISFMFLRNESEDDSDYIQIKEQKDLNKKEKIKDRKYIPNPILSEVPPKIKNENGKIKRIKAHNRIVFLDSLGEDLDNFVKNKFMLMNTCSYLGDRKINKNMRKMCGFTIDLDGVTENNLLILKTMIKKGLLTYPDIISNSGYGLHLTFLLNKNIDTTPKNLEVLNKINHCLYEIFWVEGNTTILSNKSMKALPIGQGYRAVGCNTKYGDVVTGYINSNIQEKRDIDFYYKFILDRESSILDKTQIPTEKEIENLKKFSKYVQPEYKKEKKKNKKKNKAKKKNSSKSHKDPLAFYRFWKGKVNTEKVVVGHRYFRLFTLAIAGKKNNVPIEVVRKDLEYYKQVFEKETGHIAELEDDIVECALKGYENKHITHKFRWMEKKAGFPRHETRKEERKRRLEEQGGIKRKREKGAIAKKNLKKIKLIERIYKNNTKKQISEIHEIVKESILSSKKYDFKDVGVRLVSKVVNENRKNLNLVFKCTDDGDEFLKEIKRQLEQKIVLKALSSCKKNGKLLKVKELVKIVKDKFNIYLPENFIKETLKKLREKLVSSFENWVKELIDYKPYKKYVCNFSDLNMIQQMASNGASVDDIMFVGEVDSLDKRYKNGGIEESDYLAEKCNLRKEIDKLLKLYLNKLPTETLKEIRKSFMVNERVNRLVGRA